MKAGKFLLFGLTAMMVGASMTGCGVMDQIRYEEDPNEITGSPDDYGWTTYRGYDQMEWRTSDGNVQTLYMAGYEEGMMLVYDKPSFEEFTTINYPFAMDVDMYELSDANDDGNGDFIASAVVDGVPTSFIYLYNPETNTFEYSEEISNMWNFPGEDTGVTADDMYDELCEGLSGAWFEDDNAELDRMEITGRGEVFYRDSNGDVIFSGTLLFEEDENPDGSAYYHCYVYDNETNELRFGFHYPDEGVISFYDDSLGGKTFIYGSDAVG